MKGGVLERREEDREGVHNLRKTTARHQMAGYGPLCSKFLGGDRRLGGGIAQKASPPGAATVKVTEAYICII